MDSDVLSAPCHCCCGNLKFTRLSTSHTAAPCKQRRCMLLKHPPLLTLQHRSIAHCCMLQAGCKCHVAWLLHATYVTLHVSCCMVCCILPPARSMLQVVVLSCCVSRAARRAAPHVHATCCLPHTTRRRIQASHASALTSAATDALSFRASTRNAPQSTSDSARCTVAAVTATSCCLLSHTRVILYGVPRGHGMRWSDSEHQTTRLAQRLFRQCNKKLWRGEADADAAAAGT
jgi:hypothetical protein